MREGEINTQALVLGLSVHARVSHAWRSPSEWPFMPPGCLRFQEARWSECGGSFGPALPRSSPHPPQEGSRRGSTSGPSRLAAQGIAPVVKDTPADADGKSLLLQLAACSSQAAAVNAAPEPRHRGECVLVARYPTPAEHHPLSFTLALRSHTRAHLHLPSCPALSDCVVASVCTRQATAQCSCPPSAWRPVLPGETFSGS